jgi:hypothetical protein
MANVYLDNFSLSNNLADYANLFVTGGTEGFAIVNSAPMGNRSALNFQSGSIYVREGYIQPVNFNSKSGFIGGRTIFSVNCSGQGIFLVGYGNACNCQVNWNSDASLSITDKNGTVVATSSPGVMTPEIPLYLEIGCVSDPVVGSVIVRVSGVVVAQASNIDTDGSGRASNVGVGFSAGPYTGVYITDLYVNDNTGSTWNGFMGDIEVQTIFPTAASVSQLTPNGGSSNAAIAAQVPPNMSVFNETETPGFQDVYIGNALATNTESVLLVVQRSTAFTTPGGTHNLEQVIVSEGSTTVGDNHPMTTANGAFEDRYVNNPTTGNPWTIADINAIQFGDQLVD